MALSDALAAAQNINVILAELKQLEVRKADHRTALDSINADIDRLKADLPALRQLVKQNIDGN